MRHEEAADRPTKVAVARPDVRLADSSPARGQDGFIAQPAFQFQQRFLEFFADVRRPAADLRPQLTDLL